MSDPVSKPATPPAGPVAPKAPPAVKEVEQTVRHAAGQALGPNETLSDAELAKLHG